MKKSRSFTPSLLHSLNSPRIHHKLSAFIHHSRRREKKKAMDETTKKRQKKATHVVPAIVGACLRFTPLSGPARDAATDLVLAFSTIQAERIAHLQPTIFTAPTFVADALLRFARASAYLSHALPMALGGMAVLLASPVVNVAGVTCPAFFARAHAIFPARAAT